MNGNPLISKGKRQKEYVFSATSILPNTVLQTIAYISKLALTIL
jgi:hypothetical protein